MQLLSLFRKPLASALLLGALVAAPIAARTATAGPAKKAGKTAGLSADEPSSEAGPPQAPPPGSSPLAELKKSNAALKKLYQKQPPSWSPENDAKRAEMRKIMSGFIDFEELARRSLARHWDEITPKQRAEFVAVLRDLIERNYITQVHGQPSYDLRFDKESLHGSEATSEATVDATLDSMSNGKPVKVAMEYKLLYKKRWLVYDVITDEQSMLENYRAEFNRIITKESFDALMKRMKKKLEKTD